MHMSRYDTTTREYRGHTITVSFERDDGMKAPWKEHDGHGIVSEWTSREKRAGERTLNENRGSKRYYDIEETTRIAKREGWGLTDEAKTALAARLGREPTPNEIIADAVQRDFDHLKAWCDNHWEWVYCKCEISGMKNPDKYTGGIEGIPESIAYHTQEAIDGAIFTIDRELAAREDAACRDILTCDNGMLLIPALC
jgi:hypothetical protein